MGKIPGTNSLRMLFKSGLHDLIFSVTNRCDSHCVMCYYWESIESNHKDDELNLDEITSISSNLNNFYTLLLTGGEPTLREDLPEICSTFYRKNNISAIFLPTNGLHPERTARMVSEISNFCQGCRIDVLLPIEAPNKLNDELRGVPGAFERVLETIRLIGEVKIKQANITLAVNTVLSNRNMDLFPELERFVFTNTHVDMHHFSPVRGEPRDSDIHPPGYAKWADICREAEPYASGYFSRRYNGWRHRLILNSWRSHKKLVGTILKNRTQPFRCLAGRRIAVLEWDGRVRLCELMPYVFGNVRNFSYNLYGVLKSPAARQILQSTRQCACTHACFINASLAYHPVQLLRSYVLS